MTQNFESLLAQRAELDRQIEQIRAAERSEAVEQIRQLVATHELTAVEIFGKAKQVKAVVAPKFRNPATGETWTGRGRQPVWLKDKDPEQFRI